MYIPLTFLTDDYCAQHSGLPTNTLEDGTIDMDSGKIVTSSKPLPNDGKYDLTFDQWHQVWRRLLKLITEFLLEEYHAWNIHFTSIRDKESRAENWKLWVMNDTELRRQPITSSVDPSCFHPVLRTGLQTRYMREEYSTPSIW